MPRLSTTHFERSLPGLDDLEDSGFASANSIERGNAKLRIAWLSVTLTGVIGLAYSSMLQSFRTSTVLVLIALLCCYAGYGYFLKKKSTNQFGDSVYYMGFLWAMFSLIANLVVWPAPKLTANAILTLFGYALVTTFCGMLLRLLIVQFKETHPDRLMEAHDNLDRYVAALTQEIQVATDDMRSFRDRALGDLSGTLQDLRQSLTGIREKIAEQHQTMSAGFESSLKEFVGRLGAIQIPQETLTVEVAKLVDALGKQGEGVEAAVHKLEASLMQAAETVTQFGDSFFGSESAKQVGIAVNDLHGTIKERAQEFADLTIALEGSRLELNGQLNNLQSVRAAFGKVSTQLATLETELSNVSATAISADVRSSLINVQKAVDSSLDASKAIESTMRGVMFFLRDRVTQEGSANGK
ncbi:membrane protein of unknown function [Nitrospira sp. KM1]|uniref:hypothetical protein n=1 Tax=Nitrospira sp. KM1 TaxID=1936990 RepID=UPI0013A76EBC|nr:hypothetical protein [Nitrospira sp. KM1]BCA53788.1 membrane protein of unknown function [Nitrospira sp. KM1]